MRRMARTLTPATVEMGRSTDADGDGNTRKTSSAKPLNRTLDTTRFVDVAHAGLG
jgi:hypothetical protein